MSRVRSQRKWAVGELVVVNNQHRYYPGFVGKVVDGPRHGQVAVKFLNGTIIPIEMGYGIMLAITPTEWNMHLLTDAQLAELAVWRLVEGV